MSEEEKQEGLEKVQRNVIVMGANGLIPKSFDDLWRIGNCIVRAGMCQDGETVEAQVLKLQMGCEVGLTITQSIQNIYVVNHRPSLWGNAIPGLVEASGKQEYFKITQLGQRNPDGSFPDNYGYKYTTKRVGKEEYSYSFTVADAKKAALWNKTSKSGTPSTWVLYPDRMLLNRARTFTLNDVYSDVLKGISTVEEQRDVVDAEFEVETAKPEYHMNLPEQIPVDAVFTTDADGNKHFDGKIYGPKGYFIRAEEQKLPQQDTPQTTKSKKKTEPAPETKAPEEVKPEDVPVFDYKTSENPDRRGNYHQGGHVFTSQAEYLCEDNEYSEGTEKEADGLFKTI
jgi:hypothetical protein